MKKFINKKSILEKGGMMVEALAMLGLMAVVTPTMYKKSAERTLEVEDINTATTVRTYMNAVNSLMAANYTTIVKDMEDSGSDVKEVNVSGGDLDEFLPYNFQVDHALYEYETPKISIVKNGNNLTAFALFPARAENEDDSIGQERTARIASLVGASGGYVRGPNSARGVGGIWTLNGADYSKVFPSDNSPVYSLVASTSNAVNGSTQGGDLDNSKYLQRTYEGDEEKWRNTMRTDLYMGGYNDGDEHPHDTPEGATMHSIRSVDSMIIGTENVPSGVNNIGLYVSPDATNKNAIIGGSVKAAAEQLFVDSGSLQFAKKTGSASLSRGGDYLFKVNSLQGDMEQYGNLSLAEGFASDAYCGMVHIGGRGGDGKDFVISATHGINSSGTELSLVRENMFHMETEGSSAYSDDISYDSSEKNGQITMMRGGYNKINEGGIKSTIGAIQYSDNGKQVFPVIIGSNTRVRGLLAADQIDTNRIRTATLKTGSEKVDDQYQWLDVDKDGVRMYDYQRRSNGTAKVAVDIDHNGFRIRSGGDGTDDESDGQAATFAVNNSYDNYSDTYVRATARNIELIAKDDSDNGHVLMGNGDLKERIRTNEFYFGYYTDSISNSSDSYSNFRVLIGNNGSLDLVGSNFNVVREDGSNVVSIAGNDREQEVIYTGDTTGEYHDDMVNGSRSNHYDMAIHGQVAFTPDLYSDSINNNYKYMAIGKYDANAGIDIYADSTTRDEKAVMFDLKHKETTYDESPSYDGDSQFTVNGQTIDPGTVYIRKGSVSIMPSIPSDDVGGNGSMVAKSSSGSVQASRFVANNLDANGNYVSVPALVKQETYNTYNGSAHLNRYDTYMVNPAYTSVMHDIKLTTRGGARLSDVLPDFITKGIYIANNNKDDNITNFTFNYHDVANGRVGGKQVLTSSDVDWASPYTGSVPAPQCPPGYMRVITVNPLSMNMAQAGNLVHTDTKNSGPHYLVEEQLMATSEAANAMNDTSSDDNLKDNILPQYRQLSVEDTYSDYRATMKFSGYSDEFVVEDINNMTARSYAKDGSQVNYVLTAKDVSKTLKPFIFQQNTWLKALTVPLCDADNTVGSTACNGQYTRAWAILLGFVYPTYIYDDYLSGTGSKHVDAKGTLSWNVFPVVKDTLEATVTTYCYFNRTNLQTEPFADGYSAYVDTYHPLKSTLPDSYHKVAPAQYLNRLNDPNLKYNEVW